MENTMRIWAGLKDKYPDAVPTALVETLLASAMLDFIYLKHNNELKQEESK